jgi:uncharacterized OB-fold protein
MARLPIEPGIFALPGRGEEAPRLIANRCDACGAVFHPSRPLCLACHARAFTDQLLSGNGALYALTHVYLPLRPGRRASGDYWVAQVDLDDGPRVQGLLSPDIAEPRVGMRVELALETLRVDEEGNETVVHHFRARSEQA